MNPYQDTNITGFILLESVVALAMVSILALSSLVLLQNISSVYSESSRESTSGLINKISSDPSSATTGTSIKLESRISMKGKGTWQVFSYRTRSGKVSEVAVFVPDE